MEKCSGKVIFKAADVPALCISHEQRENPWDSAAAPFPGSRGALS